MSLPKNKYAALEELLRSMFDETELRAFIHRLPEADRLVASLPGATASLLKVVFDAINLLNRHGVIDADFFEALARERPRMCGNIAEVALVWEVTLPDSVTASQSGASAASQPKDKSQPNVQSCEALVAEPAEEIPTKNKPSPPTSPERWDVFVSYAHEDQEWVRLLVENLHELGLEVFYDEWEIDYGDTVSLRLSDGLRRSRSGVLVVSPTAVSRPWVLEEYASLLEGAVQRGQRLIPVLYLDAAVPAMLSSRRWIDLRGKTGDSYLAEVARLAAALKGERPMRPKRGQGLRAPGSSVVVPTSSVDPTPTPESTTSPAPTITSAEVVKASQGRHVEMTPRREDSAPAAYRWLHLSDLHIGCRGEAEWIQMVDDFERSLDEWLPRVGAPDLVLLTGDLTNRGLREEFARLDVFLERLLTRVERHSGGARPLVIPVPGNHDLQRPSEDDLLDNYAAYERYIVTDDRMGQRLHKRLWEADKGTESAERVGQLFAEYIGWLERAIVPRLTSRASEVKLHTSFFPGDLSVVVELPGRGFPLAVVGLNSSWLQLQGGDHERKLAMPLAQFHAALPGDSPLDLFHRDRVHRSLLMMHHPPTWLAERFEREFLRGIYRPERFAICLHGHMHEPTSERRAVAGGEDRLFFQAPSLFGLEHYGTSKESRLFGYSFGELREDGEVRAWPLDRVVKGDGVSEFVPDHRRWRWLDTPADESVEYRQHVRLRHGDGRRWRSRERSSVVEGETKPCSSTGVDGPGGVYGVHQCDGVQIQIRHAVEDLVWPETIPANLRLTYGRGEISAPKGNRTRSMWSEQEVREVAELKLWLCFDGVSELRFVCIADETQEEEPQLCILGCISGESLLWGVEGNLGRLSPHVLEVATVLLDLKEPEIRTVNLRDYRRQVDRLLEGIRERVLSELKTRRWDKLKDIDGHFEPPDVFVGGANRRTSALEALDGWIGDNSDRVLLLGQFGAGKSSLLTCWSLGLWERGAARLPVLVPLLEAGAGEDAEQLLLRALGLELCEQECARLKLLLQYRRLVPCFDGVDELVTRTDEDLLQRVFRDLATSAGPTGKVLIAARDHTFASDAELTQVLPKAMRLTISPLSENQISNIINVISRGEGEAADTLRRIRGIHDLSDLIRRPILLSMVLQSLDELDPIGPIRSVDIYNGYLARWLRHCHVGDDEVLSDDMKIFLAEVLAVDLWGSKRATCSIERLRRQVREVLPELDVTDARIDSVYYEVQSGAFFVRERDCFRFAHRSFLEYFFARALARHVGRDPAKLLTTSQITPEALDFLDQILRKEYGDPLTSAPIQGIRRWLMSEAEKCPDGMVDPRTNAVHLLLELPKLDQNLDRRQWVPENARLCGIDLTRHDPHEGRHPRIGFLGYDLRFAQLAEVDLTGADLSGSDLSDANLRGAKLAGATLDDTRLDRADLSASDLRGARMIRVEADRANFTASSFAQAELSVSMCTDCEGFDMNLRLGGSGRGGPSVMSSRASVFSRVEYFPLSVDDLNCVEDYGEPFAMVRWSPAGRRLVLYTYSGIPDDECRMSVFDLQSIEGRGVLPAPWPSSGCQPVWSGDGASLAWISTDGDSAGGAAGGVQLISYAVKSGSIASYTLSGRPCALEWLDESTVVLAMAERRANGRTGECRLVHVSMRPTPRTLGEVDLPGGRTPDDLLVRGGQIFLVYADRGLEQTRLRLFMVLDWSAEATEVFCQTFSSFDAANWDISSDGKQLVLVAPPMVYISDLATGRTKQTEFDEYWLTGGENAVERVRFSPDGSRVLASGAYLVILDAVTLAETEVLGRCSDDAAWSPDGRMLAAVYNWGGVDLFSLETDEVALAGRVISGPDSYALCTPGGFIYMSDPSSRAYCVAVCKAGEERSACHYLPLAGLRRLLHSPERVQAAFRGDFSRDDITPILEEAGWSFAGLESDE